MTNMPAVEAQQTIFQSTNQFFFLIFRFLENHSILATLNGFILLSGFAVYVWAKSLDPAKIPAEFKCASFATDIIYSVRGGAANFVSSFLMGLTLFFIAIALDGFPGISSLLVQFLTYVPTMIVAVVQLLAALAGIRLIKKHTGI